MVALATQNQQTIRNYDTLERIASETRVLSPSRYHHAVLGTRDLRRQQHGGEPSRAMLGQLTNLIYCYYYLADPQAMQSLLDMNRKATPIQALEDPQFRRRLEEANLGTGYLDQGWTVTAIELAEANRRVIVRKGRLSDGEALAKYKEQVQVEQTIDFLKSPIQVRPMWLHSPKRLAGLTLLIMVVVLASALLKHQVRRWIQGPGQLLRGLMPEGRDNPYPTARALLRAFQDYTLVLVIHSNGQEEVHYPKLRPVCQQVWEIMGLDPLPGQTLSGG